MIVGKNWKSGSDETSMGNFKAITEKIQLDTRQKFRFNTKGLLRDQGITAEDVSSVPDISFIVEHGYVYLASKEFFVYGSKNVEIIDPTYVNDLPDYLEIALGGPYDIPSGIPGSGVFSVYDLKGVPKLMSPLIVDGYPHAGPPPTVVTKRTLNEVDRGELTILKDRNTGLEEPLSETYETDTIRDVNHSEHDIIRPDDYIYDPLTGKVYIKGSYNKMAFEYENSDTGDVKLGTNFSASRVGRDSGLLVLSSSEEREDKVRSSRGDLSARGSNIFIKQFPSDKVEIEVGTLYRDIDGNRLYYTTVDNNARYAIISLDGDPAEGTEIYIGEQLIGATNEDGMALVPIIGTGDNELHGIMTIEGSYKLHLESYSTNPYTGELFVIVRNPVNDEILQEEILQVPSRLRDVSVGGAIKRVKFVGPGDTTLKIEDIVRLQDVYIQELHQSWLSEKDPVKLDPLSFGLDMEGNGVVAMIDDPLTTGGYLTYFVYDVSEAQLEGGQYYGV